MSELNKLELTDQELEMLNTIVRAFKLDLTSEQALLIRLGKQNHPVLDLTLKVALLFEARAAEVQKGAEKAPVEAPEAPVEDVKE